MQNSAETFPKDFVSNRDINIILVEAPPLLDKLEFVGELCRVTFDLRQHALQHLAQGVATIKITRAQPLRMLLQHG